MKEDLTVHPISLKQIVENLDKIDTKVGKFGEPSNTLSKDEKRRLNELVRQFNEYGKALRGDQALMETAKTLSEIAAMAKKFAMNENNADFIQKETVQRDFKQVENITGQFQKLAKECVNRMMQLNALYEDVGNIYERYFEMENINEVAPVPAVETSLPMSECPHDMPQHDIGAVRPGVGPGEEQEEYASGFEENIQEIKKK